MNTIRILIIAGFAWLSSIAGVNAQTLVSIFNSPSSFDAYFQEFDKEDVVHVVEEGWFPASIASVWIIFMYDEEDRLALPAIASAALDRSTSTGPIRLIGTRVSETRVIEIAFVFLSQATNTAGVETNSRKIDSITCNVAAILYGEVTDKSQEIKENIEKTC